VRSLYCQPNASLVTAYYIVCREILSGQGRLPWPCYLNTLDDLGCERTHAQCRPSLISFRKANGGWCSLPLSLGPKSPSPKRPAKSSWPSDGRRLNVSSRTSMARGNRSTIQQRPLHWPTTRVSTTSSINYTLDTVHFAQGAPSPLCGTLSVGKKPKSGRNKTLEVLYAPSSLSVRL